MRSGKFSATPLANHLFWHELRFLMLDHSLELNFVVSFRNLLIQWFFNISVKLFYHPHHFGRACVQLKVMSNTNLYYLMLKAFKQGAENADMRLPGA